MAGCFETWSSMRPRPWGQCGRSRWRKGPAMTLTLADRRGDVGPGAGIIRS